MAMAAADGLFRCVYEGCISGHDNEIERRPYHRNCGCALHSKSGKKNCKQQLPSCSNVLYPMRRSWSEGSLSLVASAGSSPSSSPAAVGVVAKLRSGSIGLQDPPQQGYN